MNISPQTGLGIECLILPAWGLHIGYTHMFKLYNLHNRIITFALMVLNAMEILILLRSSFNTWFPEAL